MNKTSKKDNQELEGFQTVGEVFSFSPLRGIIIKDFEYLDNKLSSLLPSSLVPYRWAIVAIVALVLLFLVTHFVFAHAPASPQVIVLQVPANSVQSASPSPSTVMATVPVQLAPQASSTNVPIKITDLSSLQKVGGFSKMFRELETSLFSELNDDFN